MVSSGVPHIMNGELMKYNDEDSDWSSIIRVRRGWFDINLSELWSYRDLILLFVRRDFVSIIGRNGAVV